ncbi:MAG: DUF4863 family protein [Deltaproteobacteria bacterium]|nr:DUF4863 family protein [Deltaproteobacteria bacterium]
MDKAELVQLLAPLCEAIANIDPDDKDALVVLQARFPIESEAMQTLKKEVRAGISAGWLCDQEAGGVRFSRVQKAGGDEGPLSIDAVHMDGVGPGHTHPKGEFDLCFVVSGTPTFDGNSEGWTVYGKNTWHEPTVSDGVMDILYFLPDGEMRFEKRPA